VMMAGSTGSGCAGASGAMADSLTRSVFATVS